MMTRCTTGPSSTCWRRSFRERSWTPMCQANCRPGWFTRSTVSARSPAQVSLREHLEADLAQAFSADFIVIHIEREHGLAIGANHQRVGMVYINLGREKTAKRMSEV